MNKPAIGFGIVGCGMIARWHAAALAAIAQSDGTAQLIGVADQDCARATAFAAERNVSAYSGVADLVADERIQAVCICTPNGTHAETALAALRAGKHVLIEKPLALCVQDCDKLIEEARRQNVCAGVVSQLRFGEAIQAVRALLQSEGLGRMICAELSMRYHRESAYYQNSAWHGTREMDGGGALMNQGIHGIDLLLHLMGPVQQVWGLTATRVHSITVEDTAVAALRFASGALGTVVATTAAAPGYPRRMTLTGERGSITLTEDGLSDWQVPGVAMPNCARTEAHGAASPDGIPLRGHINQLADFVQAIRHARPCAVTLEDGRRAVELITAIYAAAHTGKMLNL